MDLLTTKEKFDYNCYNAKFLNRNPIEDMYCMSESNGVFFGHIGIDKVGIEYVFGWYGQQLYLKKKTEFQKQPRNKRGQFTTNNKRYD